MNNQALQGPSFFGIPVTPTNPQPSLVQYFQASFEDNKNKDSNNQTSEEIKEIQTPNLLQNSSSIGTDNLLFPEINPANLPKLQNIVSTANLKCALELKTIALKAKNSEYNPKRFAAVIMRIKEPKTTALIFASGKMVCTGARSEQDSRKAARQYAKIIQKLGYDKVRFSEFKIQNIVGSCDVKFQISLEGLSAGTKSSSYEPEIFPGLIFKMLQPKIVLLIFVSGKIVLTGAKEKEEIFEAFKKIYPVLQRYKKKTFEKTNDTTSDQGKGEEH